MPRCPTKALTVEGGHASLDARRCIGCGLCHSACPSEPLCTERREDASAPPWDRKALDAAILESIRTAVEAD